MSEEMKVYLVETVDDLLENWFPTSVYLHRESAENCAESLRCDDGYIRQFARVVEMKVADTKACQTDADGLDCGHVRNSSAYEVGYRDGSIHYELEHCPACKNIADLQEALEENAKLRKLVADAYAFLAWADGAAFGDGTPAVYAEDRSEIEDRMRELGVEVDEC